MKKIHNTIKGMMFSAGGFTCYSAGDVVFKYLSATYSIYTLIFFVSLFVLIILLVLSPWLGGLKETLKTKQIKLHFLRGGFILFHVILIIYAFSQLPMTTTYALIFITPILTTLLAIPLLKEKPTIYHWLAISMGFLGILVVLRPGMIPLELASLCVLLSAIGMAIGNILASVIHQRGNETPLSYALTAQIVICTGAGILAIPNFIFPDLLALMLLFFAGMIGTIAQIILPKAFILAPAATVAPFHYIQMLWGILFGYLIFGDTLDLWTGIGAAIIIASGFWLIKHEKKEIPDLGGP